MKPHLTLITATGLILLAFISGFVKAFVILKIAVLYHISTFNLTFYQVWVIIVIVNLFFDKTQKKTEKQEGEEALETAARAVITAIVAPLIVWFLVWIISLVVIP